MKNREIRKKIITITLLCILVLVGFLASYAYFTAGSNNNKQEALKVNSGNMALTFSDGSSNFQGSLNFGESATKTFTIENTGSIDAVARLKWDNLINTYLSGSLTYTLSYSEAEDGEYTEIISNQNIPRSQNPSTKILADNLNIPVSKTYYYKLIISLNYLEGINQTADLNAIFSTNFILDDMPLAENVMVARKSYNSKDYFWEYSDKIKKVVFENSLHPKEDAAYTYDVSEKQNGSVMSYLVSDTEDTSKYILYIQANDYISANANSSHLFSEFTNLESIEGLEYFDTSNVTSINNMFNDCTNLTSINVSNFDTSNVTSMSSMFINCTNLTTLDVSNFDTSKVTNMSHMFYNCNKLTTLDVSKFDTSNVTNMSYMFYNCNKLTTLDVSKFDTSNVASMSSMFSFCTNLTTLDVSKFDTSNVTSMSSMFISCANLTTLDVNKFDTSNVTDMSYMFSGCKRLTSLDTSNFETSKVTNMGRMFTNCNNLTTLDVSKFDTSNVTDMGYMFDGCNNLNNLDVKNFDTSRVKNMSYMFSGCKNLIILDLSSFNTSNVSSMAHMFAYCSKLTTLDINSFVTSKVTTMFCMFTDCTNLTTLDVSNFDTSNVTDMRYMFYNCNKLTTTITIKGAKTTYNSRMFQGAATENGAHIEVNYTNESSSLVDDMIATKSPNSNVVKGSLVTS